MESQTRTCWFLSRLALPGLMSLFLLAPAIARADTFDINVTFTGGLKGTGSFNTDGTCDPCQAGSSLTNFTFTVDDDTFTAIVGSLLYKRSENNLLSIPFLQGADNFGDTLELTPDSIGATSIRFTEAPNGAVISGAATISAVPEPTSMVLLGGVVCCLAFSLKRRFRKKSAIH